MNLAPQSFDAFAVLDAVSQFLAHPEAQRLMAALVGTVFVLLAGRASRVSAALILALFVACLAGLAWDSWSNTHAGPTWKNQATRLFAEAVGFLSGAIASLFDIEKNLVTGIGILSVLLFPTSSAVAFGALLVALAVGLRGSSAVLCMLFALASMHVLSRGIWLRQDFDVLFGGLRTRGTTPQTPNGPTGISCRTPVNRYFQLCFLGFAYSCAAADLATTTNLPPPTVVFLIDGTKHFPGLARAKEHTVRLCSTLPSGTTIYIRWITGDSMTADCEIFSGVAPAESESAASHNPFDVRQRQSLIKQKKIREDFLARLRLTLNRAQLSNSEQRDIWGALAAAGNRLSEAPGRKILAIFSTMADSVVRPVEPNLRGAEATIFITGSYAEQELRDIWKAAFQSRQTKSVSLRPAEDPSPHLGL